MENKEANVAFEQLMAETLLKFKNASVPEDIRERMLYNLRRILRNHLDDVRYVEYALEKVEHASAALRGLEVYDLIPKNFFSFLILAGEPVHYELVRGREKWKTPRGVYYCIDKKSGHPDGDTKDPYFSFVPYLRIPKKSDHAGK